MQPLEAFFSSPRTSPARAGDSDSGSEDMDIASSEETRLHARCRHADTLQVPDPARRRY